MIDGNRSDIFSSRNGVGIARLAVHSANGCAGSIGRRYGDCLSSHKRRVGEIDVGSVVGPVKGLFVTFGNHNRIFQFIRGWNIRLVVRNAVFAGKAQRLGRISIRNVIRFQHSAGRINHPNAVTDHQFFTQSQIEAFQRNRIRTSGSDVTGICEVGWTAQCDTIFQNRNGMHIGVRTGATCRHLQGIINDQIKGIPRTEITV